LELVRAAALALDLTTAFISHASLDAACSSSCPGGQVCVEDKCTSVLTGITQLDKVLLDASLFQKINKEVFLYEFGEPVQRLPSTVRCLPS
jgi:hypothetical protein